MNSKPTLNDMLIRIDMFEQKIKRLVSDDSILEKLQSDIALLKDIAKYIDTEIAEEMLLMGINCESSDYNEISRQVFKHGYYVRTIVYDRITDRDYFNGPEIPFEAIEICQKLNCPVDAKTYNREKLKVKGNHDGC